ncbi:spermatogenesis-associated protein 33 [Mastomys coucha]|uniref:spermatogenesis-associated protein 33 n=1 Tax=Mastomys coucha TaxID=35658 RepID=UPI0012627D0B|nr:spermatogenesis-associated protein 33 [Mastomys coucha]
MGQSKSKPREKKVEEEKKSPTTLVTKSKEKVMEKEAKQPDKESQPAESMVFGTGTSKHSRPSSSSEEKPDTKQRSSKKRSVIPQIIITRASNETLISYGIPDSEEQRTIREHADWGPYYRHRSPSTIAAYDVHSTE